MLLAGIDLAWQSNKNPSAIAFGRLSGNTLIVEELEPAVFGISEVLGRLTQNEELLGIAIDAPLIIRNQKGQRLCETEIGRMYGARGASCHTSNTKLYPAASSVYLANELQNAGFRHLKGERWQIECYPHPAIIEIFGLAERLKYKKGRAIEKRSGQMALASLLESLRYSAVLKLIIPNQLMPFFEVAKINSPRGKVLKTNEDALDSILCLYIAALYAKKIEGRLFGDKAEGYIWVPGVNCIG